MTANDDHHAKKLPATTSKFAVIRSLKRTKEPFAKNKIIKKAALKPTAVSFHETKAVMARFHTDSCSPSLAGLFALSLYYTQ